MKLRLRINNKFLTVNSRYLMMQHMEFGQTLDDSGQPYRLPSAVLQGLKIKIWYRQTLTFKIKLKDSIMVVTAMCTSVIGRFCQATVALSMTTIRPVESYKSATPQASFGIDHQVNFFSDFYAYFWPNQVHERNPSCDKKGRISYYWFEMYPENDDELAQSPVDEREILCKDTGKKHRIIFELIWPQSKILY